MFYVQDNEEGYKEYKGFDDVGKAVKTYGEVKEEVTDMTGKDDEKEMARRNKRKGSSLEMTVEQKQRLQDMVTVFARVLKATEQQKNSRKKASPSDRAKSIFHALSPDDVKAIGKFMKTEDSRET